MKFIDDDDDDNALWAKVDDKASDFHIASDHEFLFAQSAVWIEDCFVVKVLE